MAQQQSRTGVSVAPAPSPRRRPRPAKVETAMSDAEPATLSDHPASRLAELLPWN